MRAQSALERRGKLPHTAMPAGVLVVLCAVGAASSAAVPGRLEVLDGSTRFGWNYPAVVWPLLLCLVGSGLVMITQPRRARSAAAVSAIMGAQLAGHGLVAVRDWFNANGAHGMAQHNLATVVTLAAVVAVCAAVATCVGVGVAWSAPTDRRSVLRPTRPDLVVAGAVVMLAVPAVLGAVFDDADVTGIGRYALAYSLPWGLALASAGWLGSRASTAAVGAVAASAALAVAAAQV